MKRADLLGEVISTCDDTNSQSSQPEPKQPKIVDEIYFELLGQKIVKSNFKATNILIDIGNRLLLSIDEAYKKVKDPLTFRLEKLKSRINKYDSQVLVYKAINTENAKDLASFASAELEKITTKKTAMEKELINGTILYEDRKQLYMTYSGLFNVIPKKLTPTFIEKYNQAANKGALSEQDIIKELILYRGICQSTAKVTSQTINLAIVKLLMSKSDTADLLLQDNSTYKKPIITQLLKVIERKVGRVHDEEIKRWVKVNHNEEYVKYTKINDNKITINREFLKEINDFVLKDSSKIHEVSQKLEQYTNDPDYLDMLKKQSFLVQVRAYRNLTRDVEKNILLAGSDGEKAIVQPSGTSITIYTTGAGSTEFLPFQGTYKDLASSYLQTLKAYETFHKKDFTTKPIEREQEYKSLFQLEAIRSPSALLTNCMFFELAKEGFCSVASNKVVKKYSFELIPNQMPMAMSGAVVGSIVLERYLKDHLTSRLPYDYREEAAADKEQDKEWNIRNINILFDWLSYKMKINDIFKSLRDKAELPDGWFVSDGIISSKIGYTIVVEEDNGNYILNEITTFPTSVFQELIYDWYKIPFSHSGKVLKIQLKAAAEPKDPDIDRDNSKDMILAMGNMGLNNISDLPENLSIKSVEQSKCETAGIMNSSLCVSDILAEIGIEPVGALGLEPVYA